ncbi:DUF5753 domain-containing protein [Micromonospora aurantiaca (nom. illeg.)]|uniref:DUF5753 domain-containing protein n=1 Tax=Micromonospora aurantiaca (nom. illeg.) TaxID=47850 RepID=UPI0033F02163
MTVQDSATGSPAAPQFEAIVDESVLHRPISDVDAWRTQLAYLVNAAQARNIKVRVLPRSVGPHRASVAGAFVMLDFPAKGTRPAESSTVYSESLTGSIYLDRPNEVETHSSAWRTLWDLAMDERASEDLVGTLIKETYDD